MVTTPVPLEVDNFEDIPPYLRGCIDNIIERRTQERVDEEMSKFKREIREELVDQQAVVQTLLVDQRAAYPQPFPSPYTQPAYGYPH